MSEGGMSLLRKINRFVGGLLLPNYYDLPLHQCIAGFGKTHPTLVDVGAHKGSITFAVREAFLRCIAIEPAPWDAKALREIIISQRYSNCEVFEFALGARQGKVYLGYRSYDSGDKSLAPRSDLPFHMIVSMQTLDSFAEEADVESPCLIKLDVQGYEPFVCEGGKVLLEKDCVVVSEFWPWGILKAGADPLAFIIAMEEKGFAVYDIYGRTLERKAVERLIRFGRTDRNVTTDLLFKKQVA